MDDWLTIQCTMHGVYEADKLNNNIGALRRS